MRKGNVMKTRNLWSIAAAGALILSACGGTDTTDAASGEDDTEVVFTSPLGEFLGWDQGVDFDEEAAQAEYAQQEREAQEAIATCMVAEGFEYIPIDVGAQEIFFQEQFEEGLEWGSDEWIAKYGFGVSTQRFSQSQVGPDLVGNTWNDFGGEDEMPVDPNQAYLETLGENERSAYEAALWGDPDSYPVPVWEEEGREPSDEEMDAFFADYEENYVPSGCQNIAYEEIYNGGAFGGEGQQDFDEVFGEALEEMYERMESHPEVIAYRDDVQACVEEQGLTYLTEEDAYEFFENELEAAGLGWDATGDPFEGIDTSDFTDEDFERIYREFENQPMAPEKLEALAEVQTSEIAAAVAANDCGGGWKNEQAALHSVRIQLEEEFLAANADKLADFEGVFGN